MQRVNDRGEIKIKMCNWRQTSLIILSAKFWNYRDLALTEKFQFSTNAIESLNRSVKYFLGMGFLDIKKLDAEMNRFHSQKLIEATDGLEKGRLNSKRRQTILRENNIFDILKKFESLTQSEKLASLQFHLLPKSSNVQKSLLHFFRFDNTDTLTYLGRFHIQFR